MQLPHRLAQTAQAGSNAGVRLQPRGNYIEAPSSAASATERKALPQQPAPDMGSNFTEMSVHWLRRLAGNAAEAVPVLFSVADHARAEIRRQLLLVSD